MKAQRGRMWDLSGGKDTHQQVVLRSGLDAALLDRRHSRKVCSVVLSRVGMPHRI
jgi:hypothetical protein